MGPLWRNVCILRIPEIIVIFCNIFDHCPLFVHLKSRGELFCSRPGRSESKMSSKLCTAACTVIMLQACSLSRSDASL